MSNFHKKKLGGQSLDDNKVSIWNQQLFHTDSLYYTNTFLCYYFNQIQVKVVDLSKTSQRGHGLKHNSTLAILLSAETVIFKIQTRK